MNPAKTANFVSGDRVWWHRPGRSFHRVEATVMYRVGDKGRVKLKVVIQGNEYIRIAPEDKLELICVHNLVPLSQSIPAPLLPAFHESLASF